VLLKKGCVSVGDYLLPTAAPMEELFGMLREAHIATWHGREFVVYTRLSRMHFNISHEMCTKFVNDCATCIKMRVNSKKPRAKHSPILTVGFGTRGQVDLVNLQSTEFGGMKWLLTYCDHGTKFAATTPLPNNQVHGP
jgi:hypothetical protein